MIAVETTFEFERRFAELPAAVRKQAHKKWILFSENPYHPSLHTEKLHPKQRELWSFRINRQYRIIFRWLDASTALFLTCGPHSWIYRI
ncbi:type II toxin-antitoxin system RelE/ParE family toxin [Candidatus Kaiserbacteria bacterium]|nr:type II toxin-antitoxin system RelE/ParE family toxin [Candidatus Kaiserbacteria bacterium]